MTEKFDAIIVGLVRPAVFSPSSPPRRGPDVLAWRRALSTLQDDFAVKQDELRYYQRGAIVAGVTVDPVTWRPDEHDRAGPAWSAGALGTDEPLYGLPSIGTGGGTLHWGCAAYRFREADFRMRVVHRRIASARPAARGFDRGGLADGLRRPRAVLREGRVRAGLLGRAGNIGRFSDPALILSTRRRPRLPDAAGHPGARGRAVRRGDETARSASVPSAARAQLDRVPGPSGLCELRFLPRIPVPCEG